MFPNRMFINNAMLIKFYFLCQFHLSAGKFTNLSVHSIIKLENVNQLNIFTDCPCNTVQCKNENRIRVSENRKLRKVLEPKKGREEATLCVFFLEQ
jgi:hypothetical protein